MDFFYKKASQQHARRFNENIYMDSWQEGQIVFKILFYKILNPILKMKKSIVLAAIVLLVGCQNSKSKSNETLEMISADSKESNTEMDVQANSTRLNKAQKKDISSNPTTPSVSSVFPNDNPRAGRKIIRTANIKTKVANTEQATYKIERIVHQIDGFIAKTDLESRITEENSTPISSDSVLLIRQYEVSNTLSLRIPTHRLDTFLSEISSIYKFLDYRRVHSDDLTADFLSNEMRELVRTNSVKRIENASDNKGKRLDNIVEAEQTTLAMNDAKIDQQIRNMETDYSIEYSLVNMEVYQEAVISKSVKVNPSVLETSPNFDYRFQEALSRGWAVLMALVLLIVNLWSVILIALLGWFIYKKCNLLLLF